MSHEIRTPLHGVLGMAHIGLRASSEGKVGIPPLHGALLKNEQDVGLFERLMFMARNNR